MDGRCVDPRDANNPRTTDAVDRGEVSQRILAYPSTHAERATEIPEFDDDGLVSGRDEAFRGFLEAGGTSRWEDQARGERNRSACDFGPRAITYRERGGLLNRADRGRRWKPWFAALGKVHAWVYICTRLLRDRGRSRWRIFRSMRPAAAGRTAASGAAFAVEGMWCGDEAPS